MLSAEFLNAVAASDPYELYTANMESATQGGIIRNGVDGSYTYDVKPPALTGAYYYETKPAVFITWFSAIRFANWMHNGQGGPDTIQDGEYTILGDLAIPDNEYTITRNPGARWWLPSEDEWYKAAYYDPLLKIYYDYPTGTNLIPDNNLPANDTGNSANIYDSDFTTGDESYPLTDAGAYTLSESPFGTLDQGGNVWEWNEALFFDTNRGLRGGSWYFDYRDLYAGGWIHLSGWDEHYQISFRVASVIPESSTLLLVAMAALVCCCRDAGETCSNASSASAIC